MSLESLKSLAGEKARNFRNICALLDRPDFEELYESDKNTVQNFVHLGAYEALRIWYRCKLSKELGDKSIRDLRKIAAELCIPDYTRMKKVILLSEIVKRQKHATEPVSPDSSSP